jgi:tetratricopeptide (TPR) repeat protein
MIEKKDSKNNTFNFPGILMDLEQQRFAAAREKIDSYEDKNNEEWKYVHAKCLVAEKHYDEAINIFQSLKEYNQQTINLLIGLTLKLQGKYKDAITELSQIPGWKDNQVILSHLIGCYCALENDGMTLSIAENLVASPSISDSNKQLILESLSLHYSKINHYETVIALLQPLPNHLLNKQLLLMLARAHIIKSYSNQTFDPIESALGIINNDQTRLDYENYYAIQAYSKIDPLWQDPQVIMGVATVFLDIGKAIMMPNAKAIQHKIFSMAYTLLMKVGPDNQDLAYFLTLGSCYASLGMLEHALTIYKSIDERENNPNLGIQNTINGIEGRILLRNHMHPQPRVQHQQRMLATPEQHQPRMQPQHRAHHQQGLFATLEQHQPRMRAHHQQGLFTTPEQHQPRMQPKHRVQPQQKLFAKSSGHWSISQKTITSMLDQAANYEATSEYEKAFNVYDNLYTRTGNKIANNGACRCRDILVEQQQYAIRF